MERQPKSIKALLACVTNAGERSPLFWWLVEHHDEIALALGEQRIRWKAFASEMAELGLTNRLGVSATPKLAKLTWERARAFVAAGRSARTFGGQQRTSLRAMPASVEARPVVAETVSSQPTAVIDYAIHSRSPYPLAGIVPAAGPALGGWMSGGADDGLTPEEEARAEQELGRMNAKLERKDRHLKL